MQVGTKKRPLRSNKETALATRPFCRTSRTQLLEPFRLPLLAFSGPLQINRLRGRARPGERVPYPVPQSVLPLFHMHAMRLARSIDYPSLVLHVSTFSAAFALFCCNDVS